MSRKCTESESWKTAQITSKITRKKTQDTKKESYATWPTLCKACDKPIPYQNRNGKYCSRSCSVRTKNINGAVIRLCSICGQRLHWSKRNVCGQECLGIYYKNRTERMVATGKINPQTLRKYILLTREHRCNICNLTEWQTKPIPLDLDHIDGNSENNSLNNIRLLCKNCHAQTPTYGVKNRGKGRVMRRMTYQKLYSRKAVG